MPGAGRARAVGVWATWLLVVGTCLFSLAGHLGGLDWRLDLASHFRLHYLLLATLALAFALALKRRGPALAAGLLLIAEAWQVAPFWLAAPAAAGEPALKLLHFNVLSHNPRKHDAVAWIAGAGADLVLIEEVDRAWAEALDRVPGYRLLLAVPRTDNFGLALLIRHGTEGMVLDTWPENLVPGIPALRVELQVGDRMIDLLGVHTLPPVNADYAAMRDAALLAAGQWVVRQRAAGRVPVVLGDLNASPFSAPFRQLLAETGLVDSQRGFGLRATWPVGRPWPQIAIDHCLHDAALTTTARAVGPDLGSDHLPLRVDLAWSQGQGP